MQSFSKRLIIILKKRNKTKKNPKKTKQSAETQTFHWDLSNKKHPSKTFSVSLSCSVLNSLLTKRSLCKQGKAKSGTLAGGWWASDGYGCGWLPCWLIGCRHDSAPGDTRPGGNAVVSANHLLTLHCRYVHVCVVYASVIFKFSQGQDGRQVDVLYDRDEQKTS